MLKIRSHSIPFVYAAVALCAGLTFPRIEHYLLPQAFTSISVSSAIAIDSSVVSGMMALTGIVFSLAFVVVQFSALAYSPRLVLWIARDAWLYHAIGVFTATFLYALAALAWIDRGTSGRVPLISGFMVMALVVASVVMLIGLIQRLSLLQINKMLTFTANCGREAIEKTYPSSEAQPSTSDVELPGLTQTIMYTGVAGVIQAVKLRDLRRMADSSNAIVELVPAIGDPVFRGAPLLRIYGGSRPVNERLLRKAIAIGTERTFEQDPKYAIRLLVDIAIRALSPAVNDPTTAVQSLDQIGDLLVRLGERILEISGVHDTRGIERVRIAMPRWEDFLVLAFDEIRQYGATSVQVTRRLRALICFLIDTLPEHRGPALIKHLQRLEETVTRNFEEADRIDAEVEDAQGLGGPRRYGHRDLEKV